MQARDLHFGIMSNGSRSRWWRIRAGARKPEIFVEREHFGGHAHLSFHESGQWHLKVNNEQVVRWFRPPNLGLGGKRALCIAQPAGVAVVDDPASPPGALLLPIKPGAEAMDAIVFDVWVEPAGARDEHTWPGKDAGTVCVGRIPVADGRGICCVVAREQIVDLTSVPPPRPGPTLDQIATAAGNRTVPMTVVAYDDDGTVLLIDWWMAFVSEDEAGGPEPTK